MPDVTDYSSMDGYHIFSSNDLKNRTDHGEVLHSRDAQWGHKEGGLMGAPDAHYKDGKYYLYFPHKEDSDRTGWKSTWRIGIAIGDHPGGPFIPEPSFIPGPRPANRRMSCEAYLDHNPDGSIDLIEMLPEGVQIRTESTLRLED